jgi:hypothetical protein
LLPTVPVVIKLPLGPKLQPVPPPPTVIVYVVLGVTERLVPVLSPPAPPPPPTHAPPPPPPATIRYSTLVTPSGAVHVVVFAKISIIVSCPADALVAPRGFKIREELLSVLRRNDFVAIR